MNYLFTKIFKNLNHLQTSCRLSSTTIYALSSAIKDTGSAIAIIRVSGVKVKNVLECLTRSDISKWVKTPRTAVLSKLYNPQNKELLDEGIVILFSKPNSYTGEDLIEFHVHGSNAVTSAILKAIGTIDGCRPAEAGEFTKRAFVNGKITLIEAEGISDLISSKTDSQRRRALNATSGQTSEVYENWRKQLIHSIAHLEANIDFGEDELIGDEIIGNVKSKLIILRDSINEHLRNSSQKSALIKNGLNIAIIGEPNAGKSTFINLLCERDLSIVSPISGTTRDIIETWLNVSGYAVRVSDSAGIRDLSKGLVTDPIEEEGIKRAIKRAKESNVILYMIDSTQFESSDYTLNVANYVKELNNSCDAFIYILNKIDLLSIDRLKEIQNHCKTSQKLCILSCKTGEGFDDFLKIFTNIIEDLCGNPLDSSLFTTERHETHLNKICTYIDLAVSNAEKDIAICVHYLRQSASHLSQITGRITTEDILDVIFKDFCIGK